jgi:hypothetical protein
VAIPAFYWREVTANDAQLRASFTPDGGVAIGDQDTGPADGTYQAMFGTGSLAEALEATWPVTVPVTTLAVDFGPDGVCTITIGGLDNSTNATISWAANSKTQTLAAMLGFAASNSTVAVSGNNAVFVATGRPRHYWTPGLPPRSITYAKDREVVVNETHGGQSTFDRFGLWAGQDVAFDFLAASVVFTADQARTGGAIEYHLDDDMPGRFLWWEDRDTIGTDPGTAYYLTPESVARFAPQRLNEAMPLYSLALSMREFTP